MKFTIVPRELELDPRVLTPVWSMVSIKKTNPLVTEGIKDVLTGNIVKAIPGLWVACQDVPAMSADGYNVPVPLENITDRDEAKIFWIYLASPFEI